MQNQVDIERAVLLLGIVLIPRFSLMDIKDSLWSLLSRSEKLTNRGMLAQTEFINRYAAHSDALIRMAYYKLMIAVASSSSISVYGDFMQSVLAELLRAFADYDRDIRAIAGEFWLSLAQTQSSSPASLLVWLLNALPIGSDFIALASFLWLSISEQHVSLNEPLSPVPLSSSAHFVPLNVDGAWVPSSDPTQTPLYSSYVTQPRPALIPATPDPEFTLTQVISATRSIPIAICGCRFANLIC